MTQEIDTPKTWGEMTDSEKGALLLAHHEGKVIENMYPSHPHIWHTARPLWCDKYVYRVRPEPKITFDEVYYCPVVGFSNNPTLPYKVVVKRINGEPVYNAMYMKKL